MGLGRMVMEGEKALRFSPRYPQLLPQRSSVDDILANAQQRFYALKMDLDDLRLGLHEDVTLAKLRISAAGDELPMQLLASTYIPEEHRIRDSANLPGYRVLTFAQVLKHNLNRKPGKIFRIDNVDAAGSERVSSDVCWSWPGLLQRLCDGHLNLCFSSSINVCD